MSNDPKVGFCYAVLTESGSCKFGRTSDAFGRIYSHVVSAEGFGAKVERVYLTEQVEDCHRLERFIFKELGLNGWHGEYVGDMTTDIIEGIFKKLNVSFYSGKSIEKGRTKGEVMFVERPYTIKSNARSGRHLGDTAEDKVFIYMKKLQPARRGVVINRVRTHDVSEVEQAFDDMLASGKIKKIHVESRKGRLLSRYVLHDYNE